MGDTANVVNHYLNAFTVGDFPTASDYVADQFSFAGPIAQYETKEAFFEGAARLQPALNGHELLHQWENGNEVCSIYQLHLETPINKGSVLTSEWNSVEGGRVTKSRLIFDTAQFRSILSDK